MILILHKPAQQTRHDRAEVTGKQRYGDRVSQFFYLGRGKIDGRDIKYRFAGADYNGAATGDVTVRAVSLVYVFEYGYRAVARKRAYHDQFAQFLGNTEEVEYGREKTAEICVESAERKQLHRDKDGADIREYFKNEFYALTASFDKAVVYADLLYVSYYQY